MSSIAILTEAAKAKRELAQQHADAAEQLLSQAESEQALANLASEEADKIDADIKLLENGGSEPKPRVFAGKGAKA